MFKNYIYIYAMRTIIIMLALTLGVISCEKNKCSEIDYFGEFLKFELASNNIDTLTVSDICIYTDELKGNYSICDDRCDIHIENEGDTYTVTLFNDGWIVINGWYYINNEIVDKKIWGDKLLKLYYGN